MVHAVFLHFPNWKQNFHRERYLLWILMVFPELVIWRRIEKFWTFDEWLEGNIETLSLFSFFIIDCIIVSAKISLLAFSILLSSDFYIWSQFVACSCGSFFPLWYWCKFLLRSKLEMKSVRTSEICPKVSFIFNNLEIWYTWNGFEWC